MITSPTIQDLDYLVGLINTRLDNHEPLALPSCGTQDRLPLSLAYAQWQTVPGANQRVERCAARLFYGISGDQGSTPENTKQVALIVTAMFLIDNGYAPSFPLEEAWAIATRDSGPDGEAMRILEDLAVLISSNMRALTEQDIHSAAIPSAA